MTSNLHDFNRCAAQVLTLLYEAFPQPIPIVCPELDDSADSHQISNFINTVQFLADEGFIRYKSAAMGGVFIGSQLTAKGLAILNAVPDVIHGKTDYGVTLKKTLAEGSKEALKALIGKLMELATG